MRQAAAILLVASLAAGCSFLRHSTAREQARAEHTARRTVDTHQFEQIEITIPAAVWAAIRDARPLPPPGADSAAPARPAPVTLPADTPPVRINIDRRTEQADRTEANTRAETRAHTETQREAKGSGLFGFWGGAAAALAALVIIGVLLRRARLF